MGFLSNVLFREFFKATTPSENEPYGPPPRTGPNSYTAESLKHPQANRESVQFKYLVRSKGFVLIDDTPSMQALWPQTREALSGVVKRLSSDDRWDGFNVRFIHHEQAAPCIKTEEQCRTLFDSVTTWQGKKAMTKKVAQVFKESFRSSLETPTPRPVVFLIVTDNIASDTEELFGEMIRLCQKLDGKRIDPHMFRIHILHMGDDRKAIQPLRDFCERVAQRDRNRQILDVLSFHRGRGLLDSRLVFQFMLASMHIPDDEDPDLGERQPAEAIAAQYATLDMIREVGTGIRSTVR